MMDLTPKDVLERYNAAKQKRTVWESHWQECYDFALPNRSGFFEDAIGGEKRADKLFDGTAPDAVDQLAASMLAHLTPPWARWFGLTPGPDASEDQQDVLSKELEKASISLQTNFERSNFSVEMHQCYLDLVTVGTACLLFEEAAAGEASAFRFTAVPMSQIMMEEGINGQLSDSFRRSQYKLDQLKHRFPDAQLPPDLVRPQDQQKDQVFDVIEAVIENEYRFEYMAVLEHGYNQGEQGHILRQKVLPQSPFISFRWLKAPGETYGRSPVMKALPDIKTANKVVELSLKNASIAVTGIWQADDDGVLNPATIKLVPGTIIPKAVGSAGLTPLQSPGSFDLSQVVLDELRKRIRHALLNDKLGMGEKGQMTATEVLERTAEMARILGATYGRLQSELLTPLIIRGLSILSRRGEVAALVVDGRTIDLQYKSPLALEQSRKEAQDILAWMQSLGGLGPEASQIVDSMKAARFLAKAYGVPQEILKSEEDVQKAMAEMGAPGSAQMPGEPGPGAQANTPVPSDGQAGASPSGEIDIPDLPPHLAQAAESQGLDLEEIKAKAKELANNPEKMQELMKEQGHA